MARLPRPRWLGVGDLDEADEYFSLPFDFFSNALLDFDDRLQALNDEFIAFATAEKRNFESRYRGFIQNPEMVEKMGVRPPRQPALFWLFQKRYADLCAEYLTHLDNARDSYSARRDEFENHKDFELFDWCLDFGRLWVRAVLRVLEYATFWLTKVWDWCFGDFSDSALKVAYKPKFKATRQVGW